MPPSEKGSGHWVSMSPGILLQILQEVNSKTEAEGRAQREKEERRARKSFSLQAVLRRSQAAQWELWAEAAPGGVEQK